MRELGRKPIGTEARAKTKPSAESKNHRHKTKKNAPTQNPTTPKTHNLKRDSLNSSYSRGITYKTQLDKNRLHKNQWDNKRKNPLGAPLQHEPLRQAPRHHH